LGGHVRLGGRRRLGGRVALGIAISGGVHRWEKLRSERHDIEDFDVGWKRVVGRWSNKCCK
jgi:hypothetical protein